VDKPKNDKDFYGLRYAEFVVPLVKAVQELNTENKDLKERISKLEDLVTQLAKGKAINTNTLSHSYLEQNIPNPVKGSTRISYSVPEGSSKAQLLLTDALGRTLK
jgi:trimeric autotransporter adhesin